MTKTYTAKKGYLLYMLEKGNLLREDDTSDHNRLVRGLVIAVLIGQQLDHDEGDGGGNGSIEDDGDFRDADANKFTNKNIHLYFILRRQRHNGCGRRKFICL